MNLLCRVRHRKQQHQTTFEIAGATRVVLLPLVLSLIPSSSAIHTTLSALGRTELQGDFLRPRSVERLEDEFAAQGYWPATAGVDGEVPRLFVNRFPPAFAQISNGDELKSLFFHTVLPMVLQVNEVIRGQRERLLTIERRMHEGKALSDEDRAWLKSLKQVYRVENDDLMKLMVRVDIVPPALALAQAAVESDWGRSRFACQGNALFGQWTYSQRKGIKPQEVTEGSSQRVTRFARLIDSVAAYAMNLNTHPAYAIFRRERAAMRLTGQPLDAYALAGQLSLYSQQGDDYVSILRSVILDNALARFREARLLERP